MNYENIDSETTELENQLSPEDCVDNQLKINVVSILTYGFKTCPISTTDEKLNDKIYNEARAIDRDFGKYGIPVGYVLQNISSETIKGITVPEYRLKDGLYQGIEKKIDLAPEDFIKLPTKYVILLLMKLNSGLEVANGEFRPICDNVNTDDYDVKMGSYMFKCSPEWEEYFNSIDCIEPIGYGVIRHKKYTELSIEEDSYLLRFGYLENIHKSGYNKEVDNKTTVSANSAKFIGHLL